jgi:hypothetical protein
MKILNKIFGRKKTKEKSQKEIAIIQEKPTTLSKVIERYGTVSDITEYMDKGYACVKFNAGGEGYSHSFLRRDHDFDIIFKEETPSSLEEIIDIKDLVYLLGKNSDNSCCGKGIICEKSGVHVKFVIPMKRIEELDEEYLKKLESASGRAMGIYYSNYDIYGKTYRNVLGDWFSFHISLEALSSESKRIPKIANRDARVANEKITELKKKPIQNKNELIKVYENHPFMEIAKKEKLIGMLKKIPRESDFTEKYGRFNIYSSHNDLKYTPIVKEIDKKLEDQKEIIRKKTNSFESKYGKLDKDSDETTSKLYTERLESCLKEDNENLRKIAKRRMNILDSLSKHYLSDYHERDPIIKKIIDYGLENKCYGIKGLNKNEWKKYYTTYRANIIV